MMTFGTRLASGGRTFRIVGLPAAAGGRIARMPHIHRILVENALHTAGEDAPRAT